MLPREVIHQCRTCHSFPCELGDGTVEMFWYELITDTKFTKTHLCQVGLGSSSLDAAGPKQLPALDFH
jgi:hypothetical protein